jgi:excisionase family DNA binding protein
MPMAATENRQDRLAYGLLEAAELLSVSKRTVLREIASGRIAAVRARGRLVVPASSLHDYIAMGAVIDAARRSTDAQTTLKLTPFTSGGRPSPSSIQRAWQAGWPGS